MLNSIAVKASDLPASIRSLIGNAASVEVWPYEDGSTVTLGSVQWDSGSRNQYHVVHLDSGTVKPVQDVRPWPQNMAPIGETMIAPRCVIVKTGTFCGKPATPYIYARTADISPQLAAPAVELPFNLAQTLAAISQFNSVGRKRFREDFRMSQATWDSNVAALAALGLCDKRGAITVEGRNASRTIKRDITNPYSPVSKG